MSRKKWTVGDRNAFFVKQVSTAFEHTRFNESVRTMWVANDKDCTVLAGDLDKGFVGVIAAECVHWEEGWVSVWKVVRDE